MQRISTPPPPAQPIPATPKQDERVQIGPLDI